MTRNDPAIPADGTHRYAVRVYYEDTDAGGIVYHAGYLRYVERGRTEALRDLGIPHAEMTEHFGLMFVVRRVEVDYLHPARLDDSLSVETSVLEVGGASVVLRQDVVGSQGVCAGLKVRLACVAPGGSKPKRMPPRWRLGLSAMRDARRADGLEQGDSAWIGQ